jgi:hypothetical protein
MLKSHIKKNYALLVQEETGRRSEEAVSGGTKGISLLEGSQGLTARRSGRSGTKIKVLYTKINLNCILRSSPYRPVNTLRLGYKNQPVNAV